LTQSLKAEPGDPLDWVELETRRQEADPHNKSTRISGEIEGLKVISRVRADRLACFGRGDGRGRLTLETLSWIKKQET